ncbi:hypothetical protein MEQU1_001462 [Malassezia equina]|uniref:Zn(2)-C6 fungal-type domain-containing protein n=1 Tax=Malassezia equina TaxID=1381935 RepID=A0AAF0EC10_9BASI|nr:hypothetical protein MEQU1_001462 [Malassezia equina]
MAASAMAAAPAQGAMRASSNIPSSASSSMSASAEADSGASDAAQGEGRALESGANARLASHGASNTAPNSSSSSGQNKFRCRVAMACVHCRHRKIRCDGAQPSCYTCTRLQRKCEYERVSEQDNLLSRERKRLSRERKAARLAASANQTNATRHVDDKPMVTMPPGPMASAKVSVASAPFAVSMPGLGVTATPTEVTPALIQAPPNDAAMAAATWANIPSTINPSTKDLMPWVMPSAYTSPDAASLATVTMPPAHDTLLSLRTTADPSLLELNGAAPVMSDASASASASPGTGWADSMSLSPTESPFGSEGAAALSSLSGGSLSSETMDPLEINTALETPLKLFSDQQMSSASSTTPSSIDTQGLSDGSSSLGPAGSMVSPLSPQLAPPSFDTMEPSLEPGAFGALDGGCDGLAAGMGLYSTSVPASSGPTLPGDPVPSSLPILSSWTHPMAGF